MAGSHVHVTAGRYCSAESPLMPLLLGRLFRTPRTSEQQGAEANCARLAAELRGPSTQAPFSRAARG